jgi:hypothetical protein
MTLSKSKEWNCLKKILKKSKFNKKYYTKKQNQKVILDLIDDLFEKGIDVLIIEKTNLEEDGVCLINIAPLENQLHFLLCRFDYQTNNFLFYDCRHKKIFSSTKKVIDDLADSKCLLFF